VAEEDRIMTSESAVLLSLVAGGTFAGILSRWGPLSGWAALIFPIVLPPAGLMLCFMFCWGHPLTMLGPSILFSTPPFCIGYAFNASRFGHPKSAARIGLGLAVAETLVLVGVLVLAVVEAM
jgi:hypothetical protein